jgi:hypothetical protein
MANLHRVCFAHVGRVGRAIGSRRFAERCSPHLQRFALGATTAAVLAVSLAPTSTADATANLRSRVDSSHGAAGCAPYEPDPVLEELAQRNTAETDTYLGHTARLAPFENTLNKPLMDLLRDKDYNASKAYLLVGYGHNEADSINALLLQGAEYLPDCTYTKYGVNALTNDSQGYVLTAVILATPSP